MALLAVMSAALWGCSEAPAGIGPDTGDPPGGTIVRTPAGEATGLLRETARPRRPWRLAARSKGTLTPGKLVHAR